MTPKGATHVQKGGNYKNHAVELSLKIFIYTTSKKSTLYGNWELDLHTYKILI